MRLMGFNLTKINAERFPGKIENLKVETSINLSSVSELKNASLKTKDTPLNIQFNYLIAYEPKIAKIELGGDMNILVDQKKGKEILKDWESKNLKEELRLAIFNGILMKSNIKALQIEEELLLPPHFNLPSLKPNPKKE